MDIGTTRTLKHKYGTFSAEQFKQTQYGIRKKIFFLLLIADPENAAEYEEKHYDVCEAFQNLMCLMDGVNSLMDYPCNFVTALGMLEEAKNIYLSTDGGFVAKDQEEFRLYRSLVLGAGNEISKMKVGDADA